MTKYAVDKILWQVAKQPEFSTRFFTNPEATISKYELDDLERNAIISLELRDIFKLGAHPFLLYSFAIAKNKGWSVEFMRQYVNELKGLELGDIET